MGRSRRLEDAAKTTYLRSRAGPSGAIPGISAAMLSHAALALRQIASPPFRTVMLKAVGLTLLMLAVVWAGLYTAFAHFVPVPSGWLKTALDIVAGLGLLVGLGFLVAPVTAMFAGLFLDDVAAAVEASFYPDDAPGRALPLGQSIPAAIRFTALVIVVNIVVLLLLLLPGINITAFFVANGYLLGREYFELAAGRFHPREEVQRLRRENGLRIFLGGLLIALVLAIPIVNFITPLFATAFMVHLHKAVIGSRPRLAAA